MVTTYLLLSRLLEPAKSLRLRGLSRPPKTCLRGAVNKALTSLRTFFSLSGWMAKNGGRTHVFRYFSVSTLHPTSERLQKYFREEGNQSRIQFDFSDFLGILLFSSIFAARGHTYMTAARGGGRGSPKCRQKERGCVNYVSDKGE